LCSQRDEMRKKNSEAASGWKGMYPSLGDDDKGDWGEAVQVVGEPVPCFLLRRAGEPGGWR